MRIRYPEIGVCGLSCRLCPRYHTDGASKCMGCKTESRMSAGCPFITCALKKKMIEFCGECKESGTCEKWKKHRAAGQRADSFKCYQTLEKDIGFVRVQGIEKFEKGQKEREQILKKMLSEYNEGRSKSFYCIAVTVLDTQDLKDALKQAKNKTAGLDIKEKSTILHSILDDIILRKKKSLKLRK